MSEQCTDKMRNMKNKYLESCKVVCEECGIDLIFEEQASKYRLPCIRCRCDSLKVVIIKEEENKNAIN